MVKKKLGPQENCELTLGIESDRTFLLFRGGGGRFNDFGKLAGMRPQSQNWEKSPPTLSFERGYLPIKPDQLTVDRMGNLGLVGRGWSWLYGSAESSTIVRPSGVWLAHLTDSEGKRSRVNGESTYMTSPDQLLRERLPVDGRLDFVSMRPEDRAYLWDMREAVTEIAGVVTTIEAREFEEARLVRFGVERLVIILGEAAACVSEECRLEHRSIPCASRGFGRIPATSLNRPAVVPEHAVWHYTLYRLRPGALGLLATGRPPLLPSAHLGAVNASTP